MDEYISREEVINITTETGAWETQNRVRELPSADVQSVKHGRWEIKSQNKFTGTLILRCTYCKNYFVQREDTLNAGRGDANFCPNCGAKMDR